jgi:hypothetical protein
MMPSHRYGFRAAPAQREQILEAALIPIGEPNPGAQRAASNESP